MKSSSKAPADFEGTIKRERASSQAFRRSVLQELRREGWMSLRGLEKKTGIAQKSLYSALLELERKELVLCLHLPSSSSLASAAFFHLTTEETRTLESDGWPIIGVDALPWPLELEFMPTLVEYCRRESLQSFKERAAAKLFLDSQLSSAGLCEYRTRPTDGLYYRCKWRTNLEYELYTSDFKRIPGEVSLGITFFGVLPPALLDPLKGRLAKHEPAVFRRLEQGCMVTLVEDRASILLNNIINERARIDELPTLKEKISKRNILEKTRERLTQIAQLSELARPFLPIEPAKFELFTSTDGAKAP